MYVLVLVINLITAKIIKKNRIVPALSFLYLGVLSGQTDLINNRDTLNYYSDYVHTGELGYTSRFEWAYVLLVKIGRNFDLTYPTFRIILMTFAYVILFFSIKYYIKNLSSFYFFYAIFAFPLETTQVRTFIMFVLIMLAFALVSTQKRWVRATGLLVSLLAPGFHSIGYFFTLIIIIIFLLNNNQKVILSKKIPFISVSVTIIMLIPGISSAVGLMLSKIVGVLSDNQEVINNIGVRFNNNGTVLTTVAFMVIFFLIYYIVISNYPINTNELLGNEFSKMVNMKFTIAFCSLAISLLTISGQYQRILRYGVILMTIYWIFSHEHSFNTVLTVKNLLYYFSFCISIIFAIVLFYGIYSRLIFAETIPYLIKFNFGV